MFHATAGFEPASPQLQSYCSSHSLGSVCRHGEERGPLGCLSECLGTGVLQPYLRNPVSLLSTCGCCPVERVWLHPSPSPWGGEDQAGVRLCSAVSSEATAAAAGIRVVGEQSGGGAGALREEVTPMPTVLLTALSAVSLEQWGWGVPQALACSPPSAQPNNSAVRAPQSPFPARIIPWPITSSCAHPCQQNCPLQGRRC